VAVASEVGDAISNMGGAASSTTIYGVIPKAVGEIIKSGGNFSKMVIFEGGSKEFQISLKDEKELIQLNNSYDSLISLTHDLTRKDEKKIGDLLDLKTRRLIKAELFGKDKNYKILDILDGV